MAQLPDFTGKSLSEYPKVGILGGEFGKAVHEEVLKRYGDFIVINSPVLEEDSASLSPHFDEERGVVIGSSLYYLAAVNEVISKKDLRTADPKDVQMILRAKTVDLRNTHVDIGLVIYDLAKYNSAIAKDVLGQIEEQGGAKHIGPIMFRKYKLPILVKPSDLRLKKDDSAESGLSFLVKNGAKAIPIPKYHQGTNYFDGEDVDPETGFPRKADKGSKSIFSLGHGLARVYVGADGSVSASRELDGNLEDGRIILVQGIGAPNLDDLITQMSNERVQQVKQVNDRYKEAMRILKGEEEI